MIDEAIARITEEMMKERDPLITMMEEHLTAICVTEAVARKLLQEGKTLKGCSGEIWKEAAKRKRGNQAHIPDAECCLMAERYFGITEEDKRGGGSGGGTAAEILDITKFL